MKMATWHAFKKKKGCSLPLESWNQREKKKKKQTDEPSAYYCAIDQRFRKIKFYLKANLQLQTPHIK